MTDRQYKVRTPFFPTYSEVRKLLRIWDGLPKRDITRFISDVLKQTGTPQNPVDWSEPDVWIRERLTGTSAEIAERIWRESEGTVNPRHTHGSHLFVNSTKLLEQDENHVYRLTKMGEKFLDGDPDVIRRLDDLEGIGKLLMLLATKTRAMRKDLLPEWSEYLREHSKFGTASTFKDTLRRRLVNVVDRGLVERDGNSYVISQEGIAYAAAFGKDRASDPRRQVLHAIDAYNKSQRENLRSSLSEMQPYAFEQLIRDLLEAMGYEDVVVTKQSGDRGVDVRATIQYGITTVTEVVQVKRHKGSIGRPVLDQLRGALPYHKAIRGTIITLGSYSRGCKESALYPGAAPITLIDGDRLLDLLEEHEIAIKRKPAYLFEIEETYFEATPDEEQREADSIASL